MDGQTDLFEKPKSRFSLDEHSVVPAKIMAIGIGGIGGKCVHRMAEARLQGVEFVAVDTDVRELRSSLAPLKLEIGTDITGGLSCGGNPQLGREVALEEAERILDLINGYDMIFIIGGQGGGTFTGAAPIFAGLASEIGAISVAMATMPFELHGRTRRKYAEIGIQELKEATDALITVPNENLSGIPDENVLLEDSFSFAEDVFCRAVEDISEIIVRSGILNIEFSDVRAVMRHRGALLIGTGIAKGPNRAEEAAQTAITNSLFGKMPINGVNFALMNVIASRQSLKLHEANSAAQIIKKLANLEDVVIGAMYDERMEDRIKVTIIASGFYQHASKQVDSFQRHLETRADAVALKSESQWIGPSPFHCKRDWKDLDRPAYRRRHAV